MTATSATPSRKRGKLKKAFRAACAWRVARYPAALAGAADSLAACAPRHPALLQLPDVSFGRVAATVLVLAGGLSVVPVASAIEPAPDPAPAASPAEATGVPAAPAVEPSPDPESPCAPGEDAAGESLEDAAAAAAADTGDEDAPPVAHCSQNAGDNQYKDPFANAKPPEGGGDPASGQGAQSPDTSTSAPATTLAQGTTDPAAPGAEAAGPTLPSTGLDAGIPAWTGIGLLLAGALLRRRTA